MQAAVKSPRGRKLPPECSCLGPESGIPERACTTGSIHPCAGGPTQKHWCATDRIRLPDSRTGPPGAFDVFELRDRKQVLSNTEVKFVRGNPPPGTMVQTRRE